MNQEQLEAKSLGDLREIAKLQGVKSVSKYRKPELVAIIMNGGVVPPELGGAAAPQSAPADPAAPAEPATPAAQEA